MGKEAALKLANLSHEAIDKIADYQLDHLVEKHETWPWRSELESGDVDFIQIEGHDVLLPVPTENHQNISVHYCGPVDAAGYLAIFLRDPTYYPEAQGPMDNNYMAVCHRPAGETFFVAFLYHDTYYPPPTSWRRGQQRPR